jgi:twin BRCT domain
MHLATSIETPKTLYIDPVMARIQRDLNSPSAAARIRANKALKSPSFKKANYQLFDVAHERQDLITDQERKSIKPKSVKEIFADCRIFVEVRTGDDNRSAGIKNRLLRDGVVVNERLYKDTTHVIFKDGLLSSYKQAMKLGIPVTTILWIEACISQKRLVDCEKFKISNLDRYERPELYKRIRRQKSMQPDVTKSAGKQFIPMLDRSFSQDDSRVDPKKHETIMEHEGMELTLHDNDKTSCATPKEMEVDTIDSDLNKWKQNIRRFTTFTPNPMEETGLNRRKTLFTPHISSQNTEEEISTPDTSSGKTIIFNSTNRIAKASRRSVFDISMNILELNCKALKQAENVEASSLINKKEEQATQQAIKPVQVRKRRLFNTTDIMDDEHKENLDKSIQSVQKKSKLDKSLKSDVLKTPKLVKEKPKETIKRRETIAYFKPRETAVKVKTPGKQLDISSPVKYIVCTNMSSADKQIINAVSHQFGFL